MHPSLPIILHLYNVSVNDRNIYIVISVDIKIRGENESKNIVKVITTKFYEGNLV